MRANVFSERFHGLKPFGRLKFDSLQGNVVQVAFQLAVARAKAGARRRFLLQLFVVLHRSQTLHGYRVLPRQQKVEDASQRVDVRGNAGGLAA